MRGKTQIAVAIGAVLIIAGVYYFGSGDNEPAATVTADNSAGPGQDSADQPITSVSFADDERSGTVGSASASPSGGSSASPWPPRVEDRTGLLASENARPRPAETDEPPAAMTPTGLPGERAGLSVLPNMGTPALEPSAAGAEADMPPNADRASRPVTPVLPDIKPVDIAAAPNTATRPAATVAPAAAQPSGLTRTVTPAAEPEKLAGAAADKPKAREHVVQSGDTYSSISLKHYGSVKYVNHLMKANPGKDPKRLYVGTKLVIPEPPAGATPPAAKAAAASDNTAAAKPLATPAGPAKPAKSTYAVPEPDPDRSYTVQPGEDWFDLARKFLGKGEDYPELYEYNKERVGGNPNLLRAGTVIELPPGSKLPAKSSTSTPPAK